MELVEAASYWYYLDMKKKAAIKSNPLHLDQQLCFALYASSRMIVQAYDDYLGDLGVTYSQFLVLSALWQKDAVSVSDLGIILHLDSGTLSPLLKKLQTKALVRKVRDKIDERMVYVELTAFGKGMQKEAAKIPPQMFCKLDMKEKEVDDLRRQLQTLTSTLQKNKKTRKSGNRDI